MSNISTADLSPLDRLLVEELGGSAKLGALIKARGGSIAGYARMIGVWPEQVKQCLRGDRTAEEVRARIATDFGLPREEVDRALEAA